MFSRLKQVVTILVGWLAVLLCLSYPLQAADGQIPIGNADIQGVDESNGTGGALPPEQAFTFAAPRYDGEALHLHWAIAPKHYLYRDKWVVRLPQTNGVTAGDVELPVGQIKQDNFFGEVKAVYGQADIRIPLKRADLNQPAELLLEIGWQGCAEGLVCYPPETKGFKVVLPAIQAGQSKDAFTLTETLVPDAAPVDISEQDRIASTLAQGNVMLTLLSFLGFGLLLAFTPCVFPMIPILSGIIVGQQDLTPRKAFLLSLTYVLAMALTYTLAGVMAGLFGQNLQATFQNPWVLGVFSGIFVLLALSMFGFYELQMPAGIQSRLTTISNQQAGGSLLGVALMGALSALIVGPCVAAPLAEALVYIGQSGDAVLGGAALFALSLGMGIPLLLIGTSAGKWLPKAGGWMETVRAAFGVLLLAVAIWLLERVLPASATLLLWAALLVVSSVYMGVFSHLPEGGSGWRKFWKGIGILLLLQGSLLVAGSAIGGGHASILHPLKGLGLGQTQANPTLAFQTVANLDALQQALQGAKGNPVMLDFYADWCTSCKEMEANTFPDTAVQAALQGVVLLKADVTRNTADDKAMMRQFKVVGPPATLFFSREGEERVGSRQVGFLAADAFAAHVRKAVQ